MEIKKCSSIIAIQKANEIISCEVLYDGDPKTLGNKLLKNYTAWQTILALIKQGDIVYLGDNKKKYTKKNTSGTLTAKDKNEDRPPKLYKTLAELIQTETRSQYLYLFNNEWYGLKVDEGKPYLGMLESLQNLV